MQHSCYSFTHALARQPGQSIVNGLRAEHRGDPDLAAFRAAHESYVSALRDTGAKVTVEPALEAYPDSVFVEDAALCLMGRAIVLRPGNPTRFGERDAMREVLQRMFGEVTDLTGEGVIDGGDILVTQTEVLIGLSARTDLAGAEMLRPIAEEAGLNWRLLDTPSELLHFKTGCGLLDEETIFADFRLHEAGCFDGYRVITCPKDEPAAANLIRFNDAVLVGAAYGQTHDLLTDAGYNVVPIDTSEPEKLDGGLSCMTLRFSLPE